MRAWPGWFTLNFTNTRREKTKIDLTLPALFVGAVIVGLSHLLDNPVSWWWLVIPMLAWWGLVVAFVLSLVLTYIATSKSNKVTLTFETRNKKRVFK